MGLYIVRPKSDQIQSLSLGTRRISSKDRSAQLEEVKELRAGAGPKKGLQEAIQDYRGKSLFGGPDQTPLTGVQFVELTDEQGERMRRERSDLLVLRDQPIGLIDPNRPAATVAKKSKLTKADCWHLDMVGLTKTRRKTLGLTGRGVTVAVLDTGIEAAHPELERKVAASYGFDVKERRPKRLEASEDTHGHGTHVAGLICGKTVGVAPDAQLMNGVLIPKGAGTLANFVLALEWAALQTEVQIVNISAGIHGWVDGMQSVIGDLLLVGVLPVVAIGNEGRNKTRSPGNYAEVISVGSINRDRKVSSFSSGGAIVTPDRQQYFVPDVIAPGEGVYSCVMGGGYEAWNGTSMAAPIVSGMAALLIERGRDMTVTDLQETLIGCCQDLGFSADRQGHGLIYAQWD